MSTRGLTERMISPKVGHRHISAQEHFVADTIASITPGWSLTSETAVLTRERSSRRDRVRSRLQAEPSIRPWMQVRAPCPVRCRWNKCGCIWISWPARPGPLRSAPAIDQIRVVRRLIVAEGRVGNAFQFRRGINRRTHQRWPAWPTTTRLPQRPNGNEEEATVPASDRSHRSASRFIGDHAVCAICPEIAACRSDQHHSGPGTVNLRAMHVCLGPNT